MSWFDIIGYLGMAFVVYSFLMKNIIWLRILNLVGGVLSCVYGLLTQTYPTAILNIILVTINFSFLIRHIVVKNKKK